MAPVDGYGLRDCRPASVKASRHPRSASGVQERGLEERSPAVGNLIRPVTKRQRRGDYVCRPVEAPAHQQPRPHSLRPRRHHDQRMPAKANGEPADVLRLAFGGAWIRVKADRPHPGSRRRARSAVPHPSARHYQDWGAVLPCQGERNRESVTRTGQHDDDVRPQRRPLRWPDKHPRRRPREDRNGDQHGRHRLTPAAAQDRPTATISPQTAQCVTVSRRHRTIDATRSANRCKCSLSPISG